MSSLSITHNPFTLVLLVLPLFTLIAAGILQLVIRKRLYVLAITFLGYLLATFTIFNKTFLIWCFVYTIIAGIGTYLADLMTKYKR